MRIGCSTMSHTSQSTGRRGRQRKPSSRTWVTSGSAATAPFQRPVVHGGDAQPALRELPRPSARRGAQVHGVHARAQQRARVAEEGHEGFGELERRARRRVARHAQARDAHRPCVVAGAALVPIHALPPSGRNTCRRAARRRAAAPRSRSALDARRERAGERGQLLAFVGVRKLDPHVAPGRSRAALRAIAASSGVTRSARGPASPARRRAVQAKARCARRRCARRSAGGPRESRARRSAAMSSADRADHVAASAAATMSTRRIAPPGAMRRRSAAASASKPARQYATSARDVVTRGRAARSDGA